MGRSCLPSSLCQYSRSSRLRSLTGHFEIGLPDMSVLVAQRINRPDLAAIPNSRKPGYSGFHAPCLSEVDISPATGPTSLETVLSPQVRDQIVALAQG